MSAREQRVAKVIAEAPARWRGILRRAYEGTGGRANAITAMCLHCVGYEVAAVRDCTGWSCPLWQYRPYAEGAARPEKSGTPEKEEPGGNRAEELRADRDAEDIPAGARVQSER